MGKFKSIMYSSLHEAIYSENVQSQCVCKVAMYVHTAILLV